MLASEKPKERVKTENNNHINLKAAGRLVPGAAEDGEA